MAKDLNSIRESLPNKKSYKVIATEGVDLLSVFLAVSVNVMKRQKFTLGFPAARALSTIMGQHAISYVYVVLFLVCSYIVSMLHNVFVDGCTMLFRMFRAPLTHISSMPNTVFVVVPFSFSL